YDQGGMLQPGFNLAYNGTGRPEPVLTGAQFNALARGSQLGDLQVSVYVGDRQITDIAPAEGRTAQGELIQVRNAGGEEVSVPIPGNLLSATTEMVDPNISGWAAKLSCTLSKGTGGRNGDGCLVVKSVTAGEVQARTVSSYPVTAGTVYYAFADTSGVVPERIGIRWLSA